MINSRHNSSITWSSSTAHLCETVNNNNDFSFKLEAVRASESSSSDRIRLRDVEVLTLKDGAYTSGRRVTPIPQLKCVGGTAGCTYFRPHVVQCYNRGTDGSDVHWECKTNMDPRFQFGTIEVICEGYNYPDDEFILKGSCGVPGQSYNDSSGSWGGWWPGGGGGGGRGSPPGPGFRPEYYPSSGCDGGSSSRPGFWTGLGAGSLLGYLFGSRDTYHPTGFGYSHFRSSPSPTWSEDQPSTSTGYRGEPASAGRLETSASAPDDGVCADDGREIYYVLKLEIVVVQY
ncbi:Store-operated calcium entry-associated regulatory factor [Trichinella nelsoni]|uniref:Store-operated calcium entry-associated regulatory factor n=1 Tax=Trichinella nelsoni TaxID=6336 RepID=A0A0V0SI45_9BILA|nr:Store-operated calcium entry-associated regulatory factor [Trichinella nelsoni]